MANCVWKSFAMALLLVSVVSVVNCLTDLFLNQTRVQECEKSFEEVKDINSLETFLDLTLLSYKRNYLSKGVIAKCLGIKRDAINKVSNFFRFSRMALDGNQFLCKRDSGIFIADIHAEMTKNGGKLTSWWEKLVFEVMLRCKMYLVDILEDDMKQNLVIQYIKNIYDLAQNFNWKDVKHFIKEGDVKHTNMSGKSLQDVRYLAESSGNLDDIQRVRLFEFNHMNRKIQPARSEVEVTAKQFSFLTDLLTSCKRIDNSYNRIEPVMDLMRLNYHLSGPPVDEHVSLSTVINLWIVAVQMCDAFRLVKIKYQHYKGGLVKLTFKNSPDSRVEKLSESLEDSIVYPKNMRKINKNLIFYELPKYNSDLIAVRVSDDEIATRKNYINESSKIIGETILSQPFLDKLASYFKSM